MSVVMRALFGRNKAQNFAPMAQELGFTFLPWTNDQRLAPRVETPLFQSLGGTFRNVMTGRFGGLEVQAFDYSYTTGGGPQTTRPVTNTVAVYAQKIDMPLFTLEPDSFAGRIIDALQHENVDLDYPAGVSRHYTVHGPDKERIRGLFNERLLTFVESLDRSKGWHIEGNQNKLVLYRYRRVTPAELRDFLQETSSIAQSFFALQAQAVG
jgi:hypothetical protein